MSSTQTTADEARQAARKAADKAFAEACFAASIRIEAEHEGVICWLEIINNPAYRAAVWAASAAHKAAYAEAEIANKTHGD